jgi:hypothetical protein
MQGDRQTMTDLVNAPKCCVDEWFCEPLLLAFPGVADLMSAEVQQLLRSISRHACTTNMKLECLLAETRQSVPYSKHKPTVEALSYHGVVGQAMKSFLQAGYRNPLIDDRARLVESGLPVVQGKFRNDRTRHWRRNDLAEVNRNMGIWDRANPCATRDERALQRAHFFADSRRRRSSSAPVKISREEHTVEQHSHTCHSDDFHWQYHDGFQCLEMMLVVVILRHSPVPCNGFGVPLPPLKTRLP